MSSETFRSRSEPRFRHGIAARWSGVAAFALCWELAARLHWVDPVFAPPLSTVLVTVGRLLASGALLSHILVSSFRALVGLVLAIAIGVPAGVLFACRLPRAFTVCEPILRLLSQVNPFSLMPVFLLFFGSGELVKVTTVAWVAVWPVLFYTVTGTNSVDSGLVKAGRALALAPAELIAKIVLPAAVPTIFVGLRVAAGLVFFMLVGAEMLGTTGGLGWLVHNSAMNYQIPGIYAGALVVTVLGYGLHRGLVAVETRLFPRLSTPAGDMMAGPPVRRRLGLGPLIACGAALAVLLALGAAELHRLQTRDRLAGTEEGSGPR